ncbi:GNAT family N-acetyltransferase [Neolewinella persica]|uniref:GNAT family N-acetyltransferase n=1 Tax=Neolewinella persica TaxID=70998 RepID=UPI0003808D2C|nr:GNAT family N-acetyltransferase [Neolewinella persica]
MADNTIHVVNKPKKFRFEVVSGALISKLEYRLGRYKIALVHTEVPEELQGQGIGGALIRTALQHARDNELIVLPYCPFVAAYLARHPEWNDIVSEV